jgi:site-specific DNA recombinase
MAAAELALKQLDAPEVEGVTYGEVIEAGEHLPGMAALWDVATVEGRYEMVTIILEPGGLYYDLEQKVIAAINPRPAFLPVLRMLNGSWSLTRPGICWCERNRRHRPRSHQRSPSSWLHMASCISGFKNVCQRANAFAS